MDLKKIVSGAINFDSLSNYPLKAYALYAPSMFKHVADNVYVVVLSETDYVGDMFSLVSTYADPEIGREFAVFIREVPADLEGSPYLCDKYFNWKESEVVFTSRGITEAHLYKNNVSIVINKKHRIFPSSTFKVHYVTGETKDFFYPGGLVPNSVRYFNSIEANGEYSTQKLYLTDAVFKGFDKITDVVSKLFTQSEYIISKSSPSTLNIVNFLDPTEEVLTLKIDAIQALTTAKRVLFREIRDND